MRKTNTIMPILLLVLFIASAFTEKQNDDPVKGEKKARIQMIRNENGNVTKIDTVLTDFTADDIQRISKKFVKTHSENAGSDSLKKSIMVHLDMDGNGKEKYVYKFITSDGVDEMMDFDVSSVCVGDSIKSEIIVSTDVAGKDVDKKVMIWKSDSDDGNVHVFTPGTPHVKMIKHKDDGNVIRLDDPSIVSFKKKDMGGNKEKIEIIREKPAK